MTSDVSPLCILLLLLIHTRVVHNREKSNWPFFGPRMPQGGQKLRCPGDKIEFMLFLLCQKKAGEKRSIKSPFVGKSKPVLSEDSFLIFSIKQDAQNGNSGLTRHLLLQVCLPFSYQIFISIAWPTL